MMSSGARRRLISSCLVLFVLMRGGGSGVEARAARDRKQSSSVSAVFNVMSFGAVADGFTDDSNAFLAAWNKACGFSGDVSILVPRGTYLIGPVRFAGPCTSVSSIRFQVKGHLKALTDLSKYEPGGGWIEFGWTEGLTITGGGTLDGQGAQAWPYNDCPTNINCRLLPTNLKFNAMNKTVVRGITSLNSKFFHIALVDCRNFRGSEIGISAPEDSPNTDGIHVERSSDVEISRSRIGTGDDCISIGQGNSQVTLTGIACGPGHGISVGSLGRYPNEEDVRGLMVRDCTMNGTTNGIRIKTWRDSPGISTATNMTFENITMHSVANPILIDQAYCPFRSCSSKMPSRVELSDIRFKDITGTSSSPVAVALECSRAMPCKDVYLENVHLELLRSGENKEGQATTSSLCKNVRAKFFGTQIPPPCP